MKKSHILLTAAAVALASCLLFVSCSSPTGGGGGTTSTTKVYNGVDGAGNNYALTISAAASKATYTPKPGDKYTLVIILANNGGTKTSVGTVDIISSDGTKFSLMPNGSTETFDITVNSVGITNVPTTPIPLEGGGTYTPPTGTITPGTSTPSGPSEPSGPSGGSGFIGATLNITSEQVYVMDISQSGTLTYKTYTDSINTFVSDVGGSGKISNGKLTFSIGVPDFDSQEDFDISDLGNIYGESTSMNVYTDITMAPNDTRIASLSFSNPSLNKMNMSMSETSMSWEMVMYWYADKACTIKATGGTVTEDTATTTFENINLSLGAGWNYVNIKVSGTDTGGTMSVKTGNLTTCKWVLGLNNYVNDPLGR